MGYHILAIAILLNAAANICIKVGMLRAGVPSDLGYLVRQLFTNFFLILGVVLFGMALAAYSYVLSKLNLSIAYPIMTSLGYVIVILASWLFLSETITWIQLIGFVFIISGVWMVAA